MSKRDEIVEIALSQKGYKEGPNNDTKYGEWYGLNYNPWCAMFVSWCANQVGIPEDIIPKFAGCTTGFRQMTNMGITTKDKIVPEKGDLIFFDWDNTGDYDHVGIVTHTDDEYVYTVEGNHDDNVDTYRYAFNAYYIAGYAKPKYNEEPKPEPSYDEVVLKYQKAWNKVYGTPNYHLEEDGIFGPETEKSKNKVYLKKGMKNDLVGWCQWRLHYHKGYYLGDYGPNKDGIDNDFGKKTDEVVRQFQRDNYLSDDGVIGYNTVSILF